MIDVTINVKSQKRKSRWAKKYSDVEINCDTYNQCNVNYCLNLMLMYNCWNLYERQKIDEYIL